MRVVYAGGGTGGHINPAISIADYIKAKDETAQALFIGTKRGLETKLVPKAGYDIEYIDIQGIDRRNLLKNIKVIAKLIKSRKRCVQILKEFKPDVVVCTGGYVSGPVAIAASKLKIPSIIHEQNVYPGLTVKGAEKYVNYVATSFEETKNHMSKPEKCAFTGNPVRMEILNANKDMARERLGIKDKPFVLVFGGSLGAKKINDTMIEVVKKASEDKSFSLLFGTGERNYKEVMDKLGEEKVKLPDDIKVVPYIDNMADVMAACDLVISRAGAITVSEIAAMEKASILIPSPNVVRNHQEQNAREFERNNGARLILESELSGDILYNKIAEMIKNPEELDEIGKNAGKLGKRDALEKIYELILKIKM